MKKITLVFMLLGVFTFGITGCGNNNTESKIEHKTESKIEHKDDGHIYKTTHKAGDGHLADDSLHNQGDKHSH